MKYRSAFTTVDAVIRQLAIDEKTEYDVAAAIDTLKSTEYANAITRIKDYIFDVSEQVAQLCQQTFVPYVETYAISLARAHQRQLRLTLAHYRYDLDGTLDDLLSITSLTWGSTALSSSEYRVGDGVLYPARHVEIDRDASLLYDDDFTAKATLVGTWGYHDNPTTMWQDSGDTPDSAVGASDTTFDVTSGANFETYQYLKIDDEFLFITEISSNTLTVTRGVNGTTAAAHADTDAIYTLQPHELAESAVRRRVIYLYHNPGEMRRIVALPDGTLELGNEQAIPLPPKRAQFGRV